METEVGEADTVYVYGLDKISITADGEKSFIHHDRLGSTRMLTDTSGNIKTLIEYDAWGVPTIVTPTVEVTADVVPSIEIPEVNPIETEIGIDESIPTVENSLEDIGIGDTVDNSFENDGLDVPEVNPNESIDIADNDFAIPTVEIPQLTNSTFGISYTSYQYDDVLDMYFAQARMYDQSSKRFTAVDPIKGNVFDAMSIAQYTYVLDNPLLYIDPTGLAPELPYYTKEEYLKDKNNSNSGYYNQITCTSASNDTGVAHDPMSEVNNQMQSVENSEQQSVGDYALSAGKQIILGNYTEDANLLGTAGQVLLSFSGIDIIADIRDLSYDVTHWEWSWSHVGTTFLDTIGLVPGVGVLKPFAKNADTITDVVEVIAKKGGALIGYLKITGKNADNVVDATKAVTKNIDNVVDGAKAVSKNADEVSDVAKAVSKNADNISDVAKVAGKNGNKVIKIQLPKFSFTTAKLQHEFKHASDFGINGNWSKSTREAYQNAIEKHLNNSTDIFKSKYRGQDVYVLFDKNTGLGAYTDLTGNYVGGWKFSEEQIKYHFTNGVRINN